MSGPYWTKAWNPIQGCTPVSPGCANCWARSMHERFHEEPFSKVTLHPERLSIPMRTRKPQVFFTDTCDPFHEAVPFEFIAAMFGVMAASPRHTFLLCTKRAERMREVLMHLYQEPFPRGYWPLPNVWLSVTAEDQQRADERIPLLLATPAAHRWVSLEPMLGPIDLRRWVHRFGGVDGSCNGPCCEDPRGLLHQIIPGGESGSRARACDIEWLRSIVAQCREAGTRCFVKQLGSNPRCAQHPYRVEAGRSRAGSDPAEWPEDLRGRELAWRMT